MRPVIAAMMHGFGRLLLASAVLGICGLLILFTSFAVWLPLLAIPGMALMTAAVLWCPRLLFFAWLFLGPVAAGLIAGLFSGMLALTPDRLIFMALVAATALRFLIKWENHPRLGPMEWFMVVFVGWAVVSLFAHGSTGIEPKMRKDVIFIGQGYIMPFCAYFLARHFCRDSEGRKKLLWCIIITGSLVGATGVIQYLTGVTWFNPGRHEAIRGERAGGTLASAVEYGLVVLNAASCALALLLARHGTGGKRVVLIICFVVLLAGIICSQTRSVWLGFVILLIALWFWERRLWRPLVLCGIAGLIAALTVLPFFIDRLKVFTDRATEMGPIYNRVALALTAVDMAAEKPIFGHGFGQHRFQDHKTAHVTTPFGVPTVAVEPRVPHNEWLHLWVLGGLIAVGLYSVIVFMTLRPLPGLLRSEEQDHSMPLAAWGAAMVFWSNGMVVDLGVFPFASAQVFALLGAARAQSDEEQAA